MQIIRFKSSDGQAALALTEGDQVISYLSAETELHHLLSMYVTEIRAHLDSLFQNRSGNASSQTAVSSLPLLAPIDGDTEVWAAGVTYKRSMDARAEESGTPDIYTKVYSATRPELFFKATPRRVAGHDQPVVVRADSTWDVPEPELALVINAHGEIVGYSIANDVSSRSIEGENALYLPQAKVYAGSCALGPAIVPAWEISDPYKLTIQMAIERSGQVHWEGQTSTSELKRHLDELVTFLFREDDFPGGAILCTGTALVPDPPFTLEQGDVVLITIDSLGTLRNPDVRGKTAYAAQKV
jgi:2-dehydro-3-deoxy-D-arabinonate dehydratase